MTVVVATKDRPEFLSECLRSIASAITDCDELVVAESGDSQAAAAAIGLDRDVTHVQVDRAGKSRQLNAALVRSANPVVLFTDDDCRVPATWADTMAAAFEDPAVAIAFGPVVGLTHVPGGAPAVGPPPGEAPFVTWTYAHGASLAVRRSALVEVGGFDERLGPGAPAHGEEHDLLLRLRERGWKAVIASAPPVQHLEWRNEREQLANVLVYERGSGAFLGAALRRSPRAALPLIKHRLRYQLALFAERRQRGWTFGPRTLAAFVGGLLYGVRLRPPGSRRASSRRIRPRTRWANPRGPGSPTT